MRKKILILSLVPFIFLTACSKKTAVVSENPLPPPPSATKTEAASPISTSLNGVNVAVEKIERKNDSTILTITIDNHGYDVSGLEPQELSTLNGEKPTSYVIEEVGMGGHHATGIMTFAGDLHGEFIFGINPELTFNLQIP